MNSYLGDFMGDLPGTGEHSCHAEYSCQRAAIEAAAEAVRGTLYSDEDGEMYEDTHWTAEVAVRAAYPHIEKQVLAAARKRVDAELENTRDTGHLSVIGYKAGLEFALAALGQDTGEGEKEVDQGE